VDFGLTDEQQQLGDSERSWLTRHDPLARVRETLDHGRITVDHAAVTHAAESGLLALLTQDVGGTHVDLAVLTEAHGYAASSLPLADLALAAWLLGECGAAQAGPVAERARLFGVTRAPSGLSGLSSPVPMAADMVGFVVVGEDNEGEFAAIVEQPVLVPMSTFDLTRSWARLDLERASIDRMSLPTGTLALVRDGLAVHRGLDALGAAARLLEMTVVYAGQRQQFGVAIGSFQAVKHHCANMALGVEAARSVLWAGAAALDTADTSAERSRAASAAAAYAKSAASQLAGTAVQVHGGIGFTWEHDLHLLLRRVKVDEAMDGTVTEHRSALVTL
jgi:alkylation response protein AidB-like acyl-CoA dehydrogenase